MRLGLSLTLALLLVGSVALADEKTSVEGPQIQRQEEAVAVPITNGDDPKNPDTASIGSEGTNRSSEKSKSRAKRQLPYGGSSSSQNTGGSSSSNSNSNSNPYGSSNSQPRYKSYSSNNGPYTISKDELDRVRSDLMYPYTDKDDHGGKGDLETNINTQNSQVNKQLTFLLPFFGFGLNYTWVSLNGYLGFSDAPFNWQHYPLSFPVQEWPNKPDPSFIGPFYSKCNIGELKPGDMDTRTPGVYWRLERDLPSRQDQIGVTIRERAKWDIREGIVGAEIFNPKHVIIVTWKNVTFSGGSVNTQAKFKTNTFQLVVVTDEIRTYCLFNYEYLGWTSHTEAGGSTDDGQGGIPAFVGFNAGNGTRSYEYTPYSQKLYIRDLPVAGMANGLPGRHIFRIDEKVMAGCCRREEELKEYPLTFSPEHGNMMGGTLVNVTGPCFEQSYSLRCQFDTTAVEGVVLDSNKAACIMPRLFVSGYVDFSISINGGPYYWKGKFFVETPLTAPEGVWFKDDSYQEHSPEELDIEWLAGNLTMNKAAQVQISLWGYREVKITPEIVYIDLLKDSITNNGFTTIVPQEYANRDNRQTLDLEMGLIMINLTTPEPAYGVKETTIVWSRPIPLAWYFHYQWEKLYGSGWQQSMCDKWIENDRNLRNFAYEVERCPCLLKQAVADKGRYLPDFACDMDGNTECDYHYGAVHCVRTALPNKDGAGQQCCYDRDGYLMMTADKMWGGNPHRAHNLGKTPFDEANKVPSLSHWYHDIIPFYTCCKWQGEQSPGCVTYRFERRSSQDCVGYTPPSAATVFGDPHIYTFDDLQYAFNGKGEYVLVRSDSVRQKLDIQGRFEQIDKNYLGFSKGTTLTAIAARDNISSIVEVRRRPRDAIWRYHLDVIVDGERVYFDRYSQKIQQFRECVVYTPSNILNQSHVIVMFSSGAGIEVMENRGYLGGRVYLPLSFANITRGLFGNWTFNMADDLVSPDGMSIVSPVSGTSSPIYDWGLDWVLDDKDDIYKGKSLFYHENFRSSNYYFSRDFLPELDTVPTLSVNATTPISEINTICGDSFECYFDFVVTLRRDFAVMTKYYQDQFVNIKSQGLAEVISCGALPTPPHGRKSTFNFLSGAEVKFDCDPGYVLLGEQRRWCYASGDWNWPEDGEATCVTESEYLAMQQGITAGTVLAILLPVVIAMLCYASYHKNKTRDYFESRQSAIRNSGRRFFGPPSTIRSRTPSAKDSSSTTHSPKASGETTPLSTVSPPPLPPRITQYHLGRSDSPAGSYDGSSTYPSTESGKHGLAYSGKKSRKGRVNDPSKGPQSYDGEYYTNEPVDNREVVFQNVLWDLGEHHPSTKHSAV